MGHSPGDTRALETSIEIKASPDAVWKTLTDAEELTRWLPIEARVAPGRGGSIWIAWPGEFEDTARIETWEPARSLVVVSARGAAGPSARLTQEFTIEARSGGTTLRLVHSGFGRGGEWDRAIDAARRGWEFELRGLRHYLERHPGKPRGVVRIRRRTDRSAEDTWTRLMGGTPGAHGLLSTRPLPPAGLREGDPYRFITADGETISGEVRVFNPPHDFAGTVREINDSYLRLRIDRASGAAEGAVSGTGPLEINLWLSMYGASDIEREVVDYRWTLLLARA